MNIDHEYIVNIRRQLHQYPELGFDLDKTLAIIRNELNSLGISYTEKYGKSSIVATINEGVGNKTIGVRADIDALPITEETGLPFSSKHPGKMHACGHDCHGAMLLGLGKALKEMENELKCCVKLVFQAAEEGPGGAKLICDDGLMDEIDMMIACHINPSLDSGKISVNQTVCNASSHGFKIFLRGKSSHVASPHLGIDAIAMANRVYTDIQIMRSRELPPLEPVVLGIGEFHGGSANNVVCDEVMMHGSIRALSTQSDEYVFRRIEEISKSVSSDMGGTCEVITTKYYPCLYNDKTVVKGIVEAAVKQLGAENVTDKKTSMGAEDFAYYTLHKPSAIFSLGTKPQNTPSIPLHNGKMIVNEDAFSIAPKIFLQFILDHME